jgi:hypothetical protein
MLVFASAVACMHATATRLHFRSGNCFWVTGAPVDGTCQVAHQYPYGEKSVAKADGWDEVCGTGFQCSADSFWIPDDACDAGILRKGDHCVLIQSKGPWRYDRQIQDGTSVNICGQSYTCDLRAEHQHMDGEP